MTRYEVIPSTDTEHLQRTADRFAELQSSGRALARAQRIADAIAPGAELRLFNVAKKASTAAKKLVWLQRAADVLGHAAQKAGASACRDGCAHCCHISVMITEPEARALSSVTGRAHIKNPGMSVALSMSDVRSGDADGELRALQAFGAKSYTGEACPFLSESRCSVYEDRPLACRYQISLDEDDLLCRLVDVNGGESVDVLYLDSMSRKAAAMMVLGLGQRIADIRDWFPKIEGQLQARPPHGHGLAEAGSNDTQPGD